jgi:dihydropyrimidinase
MSDYDLIIRGGTVVVETGTCTVDVGVRAGTIAALASDLAGTADVAVDARDLLVLPGGIDSHCHVEQVAGDGSFSADDFLTASRAAVCGGTTSIISFASQQKGQALREIVAAYHERAAARAGIDYAFHMIVADPTQAVLAGELPALIAAGHRSIKVFTCYDHRMFSGERMLALMQTVLAHGGLMMVHAEDHDICTFATNQLVAAGKGDPRYLPEGRPRAAERAAVQSILAKAETVGVPVLIAHVTNSDAVKEISKAAARGVRVRGETCPQYLQFTRQFVDAPFEVSVRRMCSPPFREDSDRQALWEALRSGELDLLTSDHAPTDAVPDPAKPFHAQSMGLPGLETRLPYLFSEGVSLGRLSVERFVELTATNPAKTFGLYPRKGAIRLGADADLALWDPRLTRKIEGARLHQAIKRTPFEGMTMTGWPMEVYSRGELVMRNGEPLIKAGRGQFLPQLPSDLYGVAT